jgi:membrane fusion protein (multidrug efflux system)
VSSDVEQFNTRPPMRRRLIIVILVVGVLMAAVVVFHIFIGRMLVGIRKGNASVPQTVSTATAGYSDWQPEVGAVGSSRAVRGVDITTEVTGLVRSLRFKSGDEVQSGQVLVELNPDAELAQQHALEAAAELAATVYERDKTQYEAEAISKAQLDADAADLKSKRAQAAAQAALVAKKYLRAPFAGKLGITTVNPGQYLNTGDKVVTLQALDPIYVDLKLPQQRLSEIKIGQKVRVTADAFPNVQFEGDITSVDPLVDAGTRNFQVEATIPNPERRLMPGMFMRVSIISGGKQRYLTLPQTAITYNPYGATVFLAQHKEGSQNLIAQQSFVTVGATRGDQVAITKGLKEGDVVVTTGQLKLVNGTILVVDNAIQPKSDANPSPQEE